MPQPITIRSTDWVLGAMMVKMNRLLFSILVAFTSTMAFAQSNIFDGITERGIKLYQSREAEIDEIVRLQPQYLDIPNDPNSISAKNKLGNYIPVGSKQYK